MHASCETLFDLTCIASWLETSDTCPACREKCVLGDFQPIPFIEGLLKTLLVYCPNQERGCTWTGERGNQEDHVDRYCKHADPRDDQHAAEAAVYAAQQALYLDALCDSLNPAANNVVALDVSGVLFKASRATLAKYPFSALGAVLAGGNCSC